MLCEHCGKEISGESKFCRYCGQSVAPAQSPAQNDVEISQPTRDIPSQPADAPAPSSSKKSLFIAALLVVVVCAAFFFHVNKKQPTSQNQPVNQAAAITASNSEYKNRMYSLQPQMEQHGKKMVLEALDNPKRTIFAYDPEGFTNDGVLLTSVGTVKYKDAQEKDITRKFEATFVTDNEGLYYLALKLDGQTVYDRTDAIDPDGMIVATNMTFEDRGYGEMILDNIVNPDKWAKNAADYNNAEEEITMAEFTAIALGMDYREVCATIGSGGVEKSRVALLGSETAIYTWAGIGAKDAGAALTFVDDVLIAKEQEGLK